MGKATLAGGCFWCTEAIFRRLKGVNKVLSGYSGGNVENPTYAQVSSSSTHHAESIQITFDPKRITYKELLYLFFRTHNPTTVNRQGADVGNQYRSVIFYHDKSQQNIAEKAKLEAQKLYQKPIVTEIVAFNKFYPAENYHQKYYEKNRSQAYCQLVIDPKIEKLKKDFKNYLKG